MNTIVLKNVSKKYRKNLQNFRSIFEYLLGVKSKDDFMVLDNINLEIKKGEIFGIIGKNGSGKSTLLKTISGITVPNNGSVKTFGRIAPLIEIGAGFQPELTGRENIYFYGSILGIKKSVLKTKINEIIEFSGIKNMIDTPVKFYSSGMSARLGFAITAYSNPDILIVDEVLAVGDTDFQNKCYTKIEELKAGGVTIIIVSHNMELVLRNCDRVLVLESGRVSFVGSPNEGVNIYMRKNQNSEFKYIPFGQETLGLKTYGLNIVNLKDCLQISFDYTNPDNIKALWGLNIYTKNSVQLISSHGPKLNNSGHIQINLKTDILNNDTYFIEFAVLRTNPFKHYGNTEQKAFEVTFNNKILPGVLNDTMLSWN